MNQTSESSSRPLGRTLLAALILVVVGYILLKVVIGIVLAIALPVVLILGIVGLVWAWRVLF
jgi:uncharacterized membrane protein